MSAHTQKQRDRLFAGLLAICLLLLFLLLYVTQVSSELGPLSQAHPHFDQMLNSTGADDALPRPVLYVLPIMLFSIFGTFLLIAYTRPRKKSRPTTLIIAYMLGYMFIMTMMLMTHDGKSADLFGGFPIATAWMTYGIWFFPLIFIALYFFRFETWVLDGGEQKEFERLLSQNEQVNELDKA